MAIITIQKKELKTILRGQREEYQRYLGVLAESFESQVRVLAESVVGIQKQLIIVRDMVIKNTEDIEMMKIAMTAMRRDMEIIKMDVHVIKDDMKEKIGREEFKTLEKRVMFLEKKFQRV